MTTEIELKFAADDRAIADLPAFLSQWPHVYQGKQTLANIYYESDDNFLRSHRLGLRIRRFDDQYEMTLKTEGKVIAGLHQRPEYNVALSEPTLNLSLFPSDVWPEGCDIDDLQRRLTVLFSTDFTREKWLVDYQGSEIEIALDRGNIEAGQLSEPLQEIELELKRGEVGDALNFARDFSRLSGLRLSQQSKAARGYRLSQGQSVQPVKTFDVLRVAPKSTLEQALLQAVEAALSHWQYHEELWLAGNGEARSSVLYAIAAVRQIWTVWGNIIPRKATAELREQLQKIAGELETDIDAETLCGRADYVQTKLALTQWIVCKPWLTFVDKADLPKLNGSFKRFADIMLSRTLKSLKESFSPTLTAQQLKDRAVLLNRQLISFQLLAGAYSDTAASPYIASWRDALRAINADRTLNAETLIRQALEQRPFWLNSGGK